MKKFLGVYYEWGRDAKVMYPKMITDKDVNKLLEICDNYTCSELKVHKYTGAPGTTLIKSELDEPYNIDNYRPFVGQPMWYTTNVGPEVENVAKELILHIIHPGKVHWKALRRFVGYIKGE